MQCHGCGTDNEVMEKVGRGDVCRSCGRPLRCCKNCSFHDPTASNQCREPQAEWVADRAAANFCEFFSPLQTHGTDVAHDKSADARKKLDDLFK